MQSKAVSSRAVPRSTKCGAFTPVPPATAIKHVARPAKVAAPCPSGPCVTLATRPRLTPVRAATEADVAPAAGPGPGRMTYRPESFEEMVKDASKSVLAAIKAGIPLMEVEFPPVPVRVEAYKGSSDLFMDSNVQLALFGAKQIALTGKKVHVVLPDLGEYTRSFKM
eukprot:gene8024-1254_t